MRKKSATGWFILDVIWLTWRRFRYDCRAIPAKAWTVWWQTLLIGLGITAIVSYGITRFAQAAREPWLQAWDEQMLPILVQHLPLTFARSITWESPGNLLVMLPLVITFVAVAVWRSRPLIAATVVAAYGLQFALVWIGWGLWNRDRPTLIAGGIASPSLHSFPSGHTTLVFAVYGLMAYFFLRATRNWLERLFGFLFFLVFAGLVSSARLEIGAHWPSDIIAGCILGLLWLVVVVTALNRAETYT
ncbi:phosphatase PAP2 family protein [Almyronema epifaneia]|uniref:Phosphatase PAP2 family protein n=1 Tax=Almyronema epifaneia S1 TaxID=2991925 RepID=A0ABW6ICL3_9CYAN